MTIDKIGKEYYTNKLESDIIDFKWTVSGLKITISTWKNQEKQIGIEYEFSGFNGFRFLDEGDLLGYWDYPDFNNGFHLFRIINGGWKSGEVTQIGILDVSRAIDELNEFFIATSNSCFTVLAYEKPTITEIELKD
ncbi:hypothetical protein [Ulvibacter litoralis]|uniref:Immunity protein 50 n=1 Tax=Ulvibacter litoralis TaxID=227084 RepID=A0A1G7JUX9_9FLAO|nr:hypothetical protein [Ulvibacter litoralis]GHC65764.1 hypothetical protein GCM10008083_33670 [Ulvibacter litoralis]SDF28753.1 hypothetical protein SAMN05421855_1314 [Ulvibacter litoralis]